MKTRTKWVHESQNEEDAILKTHGTFLADGSSSSS